MALNIKDPETVRLAAEVADLAGESKTAAVRTALRERKERLELQAPRRTTTELRRWLEEEVWPSLPPGANVPLSKEEEEALLGYDEYT
jgi:antitoxin VapB